MYNIQVQIVQIIFFKIMLNGFVKDKLNLKIISKFIYNFFLKIM